MNVYDTEVDLTKDGDKLAKIMRDLKRAEAQGKVSFTDDGLMIIGNAGLQVGGVFDSWIHRHELVQRAIDDADPEKEIWAREFVRLRGDLATRRGYFKTMESKEPNLIPNVGLNFVLNVLFFSTSKISTWYHGPFISNWTPVATAQSNWAGAGSGPLATELANAQFDESNRQAATFGTTASSQSISSSASTTITLATGESGITLYGTTLNQSSTVAYNATDLILLAATAFSTAKSGLGAADVINLDYTISASSS
jgi:hypothetical protein